MCRTFRRKKYKLLLLLLLIAVCLKLYFSFLKWPMIKKLTEIETCPTCFGVTLCPAFLGGQIKLNTFNDFADVINAIGSKNVMFGHYGSKKIVLKKLGHQWELRELDENICRELRLEEGCQPKDSTWEIEDYRASIIHQLTPPIINSSNMANHIPKSNLHLCPSTGNLDELLNKIVARNNDAASIKILYTNIWTLVLLNPEPLILQILPGEEGWPVPKYYGACGRVVVMEHAGEMLTFYYHKSWPSRAKIAHQLLIAANQFTDKHPNFRFYLTDVSPDNIVVDSRGKVKFVDLENVIVVDKNISDKDKPKTWGEAHTSEIVDCNGCFAFSTDDICSHYISDHNYYAVCQHILATDASPDLIPGGFLHDIPHHILELHPQFLKVLQECAQPSKQQGRFVAAQELVALLASVSDHNQSKL